MPDSPSPSELPLNSEVPENTSKKIASNSLLSDIIEASKSARSGVSSTAVTETPPLPPPPKKLREPISIGTFMRLIGSILFVAIIFFGSFLAYIAFNPSEALFFVNTFNISPSDVKGILNLLIKWSFGTIFFIVSILWIISLFRAFWTPKDLKRKRLLSWLTAGVVGLFLFVILGSWIFLTKIVGATDYSNPEGSILIYDNELAIRDNYKSISRLYNTTNLIGPIHIFFDIRSNAEQVAKGNLFRIESYEIDFDGARCNDGKSIVTGTNPKEEQSLVCAFDQIKQYNIRGLYRGTNRLGEKQEIPIVLPTIEIRGLVDIKEATNTRGKKITILDASSLKKLGTPRWLYENNIEKTESKITETLTPIPQAIGLKLWNENVDRVFILEDKDNRSVEGSIVAIQDPVEARKYTFSLSGVSLNPNEIVSMEWLINKQSVICENSPEICEYTFPDYGKNSITIHIKVASGQNYTFEKELSITEPLKIERHIKVTDKNGLMLNEESTYDRVLRAYVLRNTIIPPDTLTFDARDVISANPGYTLDTVLWKISNSKTTEERRGTKINIDFNQALRYTIECVYSFKKTGSEAIEMAQDTVIVDIERKSLTPRMDIHMSSDYVPSLISVDASLSESEKSEIKKFIFDFGEGRPAAEGDSIQEYNYTTPGDKTITLTITDAAGNTESLKRTIVLKDQIKTIDFTPSLNPGITGSPVDFDATGTNGQIEDYIWNFADNTPVSHGYNVSHTYIKKGSYSITLTIVYTDGTQKSIKKSFSVVDSL